jgi:hypothetical protein
MPGNCGGGTKSSVAVNVVGETSCTATGRALPPASTNSTRVFASKPAPVSVTIALAAVP